MIVVRACLGVCVEESLPGGLPGHCRAVAVPGWTQQGAFGLQPEQFGLNHHQDESGSRCSGTEAER